MMKYMKGFRVPFANKSAAPAVSKMERSRSQLQPMMTGTTSSKISKIGVLPANLMSPTSKEALRLHLKILKLQREAKNGRNGRKMYKKDQDELYVKLTMEKARLETFEK